MKEKDEWIPYKELDFNDPKFNVFSIDTRDFYAGYRFEESEHPDYLTISKYPYFFHTTNEVKILLDRYYKESGNKQEWRMFKLESIGLGWELKYIRIWKTEKGFIMCDRKNRAHKKSIWKQEVQND